MALSRTTPGLEAVSPCESCNAEVDGNRYFVPWSESGAAGRWLCYACVMTVWRIDTQREIERYRFMKISRHSRSGYR